MKLCIYPDLSFILAARSSASDSFPVGIGILTTAGVLPVLVITEYLMDRIKGLLLLLISIDSS